MQVAGRDVPVLNGAVLAAVVASCLPVKVLVRPRDASVALELGIVMVVPSVPLIVMLLFTVTVFPSASVSVAPVAGAVRVSLLIVPGRVRVGDSDNVQVPVDVISQVPEAAI